MMLKLGITGSIASGKSTFLKLLQESHCRTVDADEIVHGLYEQHPLVHAELKKRWGGKVFSSDGRVDRMQIAGIVFARQGQQELEWLNRLLHPLVRERINREAAQPGSILACAVPLLFETGWAGDMDFTVCLWCDTETQWRRVQQRGWSRNELEARLARQMPADEKLKRADFGIINHDGIETLRRQCELLTDYLNKSLEKK